MPSSSKDPVAEARQFYLAGNKSRAETICRQVLAYAQQDDAAWQLMGIIALDAKRDEFAVRLFMRALDIAPHKAGYYVNLAVGLHRLKKPTEAANALRRAIELQPHLAEAHFNLGRCLTDLGDDPQAFLEVELAASHGPKSFEIQRHFARMLRLRGEDARSIAGYRTALELNPDSLECLIEMGSLLRSQQRASDALHYAKRAVALQPQSATALNELGLALLLDDQPDEAVDVLSSALQRGGTAEIHCSLGYAYETVGLLEASVAQFREALISDPTMQHAHSNIIYLMQFVPGIEQSAILEETLAWNRSYGNPLRGDRGPHENTREPERKLRIGYVSAHFYNHCQSFFTTPLFENHNHENFDVFAYSCVERPDETTSRLKSKVDVWREVSRAEPAELARIIRRDSIDILVDLAMHMGNSRLLAFARKPAPVQMSWLAYPGTTGLETIDYRISDCHLDPPDSNFSNYSERTLLLKDSFWCYDPQSVDADVGELPALENGFVTFGCLNHFRKINEPLLDLWAEVMQRVNGSRLLMSAPEGLARARVGARFTKNGVAASRLTFVGRRPRPEYLGLYRLIDVCLDTHPYAGHTTSMDAFWSGVPVVSLIGPTVAGRAVLTIAKNLGLNELANSNPSDFVSTAVALAKNLPRLQELRRGLTKRMRSSPLMHAPRFTQALEAAYRCAWRDWCRGGGNTNDPVVVEPAQFGRP